MVVLLLRAHWEGKLYNFLLLRLNKMLVRDMCSFVPGVNAHFNTNTPVFMRPRPVNTAAFIPSLFRCECYTCNSRGCALRNINSIMKMSTEYWQAIVTQDPAPCSWLECVFKIILLMNLSALIAYFYQHLLNLISRVSEIFKERGRPFIREEIS